VGRSCVRRDGVRGAFCGGAGYVRDEGAGVEAGDSVEVLRRVRLFGVVVGRIASESTFCSVEYWRVKEISLRGPSGGYFSVHVRIRAYQGVAP